MHARKPYQAFLTAFLLVACQATAFSETDPLTGSWGGRHVGLTLGPAGGTLEYDCAAGTIRGPVRPDSAGHFTAEGTHTPGTGGPKREGYEPPRLPAIYSGTVRGGTITLLVRVPSRGFEIGPYSLRRGAEPIIFRCL